MEHTDQYDGSAGTDCWCAAGGAGRVAVHERGRVRGHVVLRCLALSSIALG